MPSVRSRFRETIPPAVTRSISPPLPTNYRAINSSRSSPTARTATAVTTFRSQVPRSTTGSSKPSTAAERSSPQALIPPASPPTSSKSPSPPASCNRALLSHVDFALVKELFRIRLTASAQVAVLSQVLMHDSNLPSLSVEVCYDLTASAWRFVRISWARMAFSVEHFEEFAGFHALPITPFIEHTPQFLIGDYDLYRFLPHGRKPSFRDSSSAWPLS